MLAQIEGVRAMKNSRIVATALGLMLAAAGISTILTGNASAHCDSVGGPVIREVKSALLSGDIAPVLKWVKSDDEPEIRAAFGKAIVVRAKGPEAAELADQYFIETLVRVHRAGEGAPYIGIKDEPVEPIIQMADSALAEGSPEKMIQALHAHMDQAIKEKFAKASAASKTKDDSPEAGREFVEAYVSYVHFVEGIHTAMAPSSDHHGEAIKPAEEHKH